MPRIIDVAPASCLAVIALVFVFPAKAGIQKALIYKAKFYTERFGRHWVPASAGKTATGCAKL
jgi:hypothetical protein